MNASFSSIVQALHTPTVILDDTTSIVKLAHDYMSGKDPRRRTPQGVLKAPAFVRFNPLDSGEDCDEIFWERQPLIPCFLSRSLTNASHGTSDPLTFSRRVGRNKYIDSWGIYPVCRASVQRVISEDPFYLTKTSHRSTTHRTGIVTWTEKEFSNAKYLFSLTFHVDLFLRPTR